tara:strand:+ start:374 stop:538 length:165 start_codon:yes stop_codon:yes gene_type:complete
MGSIKIKLKIQIEDIIEIDADDLMHQSIDDYMDDVTYNLQDYVDVDNGLHWEIE